MESEQVEKNKFMIYLVDTETKASTPLWVSVNLMSVNHVYPF